MKWYHSWFGTKERKFDSCIGDQSCNGGGVAQRTGLQILKTTGSNPVRCSKQKARMWSYIITFFAVGATDMLYVMYVRSVQQNAPGQAAWWAVVVTLTNSIAVINYTEDHWALVPALLGAAIGTYIGMRYRKRQEL